MLIFVPIDHDRASRVRERYDGRGARIHPEFCVDAGKMGSNRAYTDTQASSYFFAAFSACRPMEDLSFALGQFHALGAVKRKRRIFARMPSV